MKKLIALDSEDDSCGSIYFLNFYDGCNHFTFYDQKSAIDWLCEQSGHLEIWAVNLAYDINNLFKGFFDKLEITYVDSRVISARIPGTQTYFRDTLNHWKMSVEEMGKRIGLPKIKTRSFKNLQYCRRDTEICYRFVVEMAKHYEKIGCKLKATIGSTALEYFYTHFWDRPTHDEIMDKAEIEFMKRGYYGGRTEIFHTRAVAGNIQYFDINSLYPSVMRDFCYPRLDSRRWVKKINLENEGMVEIEIEKVDDGSIPYLPNRSDSGLLFPFGRFKGVFTYFEIRQALLHKYRIRKVHRAIEFDKKCYPFVQFVETLYNRRLKAQSEKDQLMSDSCKLLANNLYGKFGQGNEIGKLSKYNPGIDEGTIFGDLILKKTKGPYPKHANVIWACYTTAYARDRLYQGMKKVVDRGGLLIYVDTDSLIFESSEKIIEPSNELGKFKLEGEFRYAHFKLPKLYHLIPKRGKWIFRAKGIPRKFGPEFFKKGKAVYRRPYKLRETLRRNLSPKRIVKLVPNYWELTKKESKQTYDKRIVHKDGTTSPVVF